MHHPLGTIKKSFYFLICLFGFLATTAAQTTEKEKKSEEIRKLLIKSRDYLSNNPDSAELIIKQALAKAEKEGLYLSQIESNSSLGEFYQSNANYKKSVEYYLKAISIGESKDLEKRLGPSYNGLGISYYYLRDIEKADKYLKKAAQAKLERGDIKYYNVIMGNLAAIYQSQGNFSEAVKIFRSAEPLLLKLGEKEGLSALYNSMGSVQQMGFQDLDSATYYYRKALEVGMESGIKNTLISPYHNLANIKFIQKDYKSAIEIYTKSLKITNEAKNQVLTLAIYKALSEVYDSIGDYKNAYLYKNLQQSLNDSIFSKESQATIHELDIKYQSTKKEKLLLQQNERIQAQQLRFERLRLLLLSFLLLSLVATFAALYFWQRRQAGKLLAQEKSKIFQNIVHEIRSPLTLIKGPLYQIKKEYQIPTNNQNWKLIEDNSSRLIRMVNELLDASKLETGKYNLNYSYGDLGLFVRDQLQNYYSIAKDKNIGLIEQIQADIPVPLCFASNAIELIISNLLLNSLKYCPSGSSIQIKLSWQEHQLRLIISDNGPGIEEKHHKKIFERFYRASEGSEVSGTGIGLSIVKDLVTLMKGKIRLESSANKGTCIEITVPTEVEQRTAIDDKTLTLENEKPLLLLVEDDLQIMNFVKTLLEAEFRIIQAENGELGYELALEQMPHIILTDVMMPKKDGIELLGDLKNNPLTTHIPIMVFSAKNALESRLESLRIGADAYLAKPFHPEELSLLVNNLWHTIQKNQEIYQAKIKGDRPFEERLKGENAYINQVVDCILEHIDDAGFSVNELAASLFISRSQLHRKLDTLTGMSTTQFIKMVRLEKAKDLLLKKNGNITEIAYQCGFNSLSYFTKSFKEYFGQSPSDFSEK